MYAKAMFTSPKRSMYSAVIRRGHRCWRSVHPSIPLANFPTVTGIPLEVEPVRRIRRGFHEICRLPLRESPKVPSSIRRRAASKERLLFWKGFTTALRAELPRNRSRCMRGRNFSGSNSANGSSCAIYSSRMTKTTFMVGKSCSA